ncbi:serine/threonine protein kinase [Edaphobacter flagellatus]|uniref:serine/threonine protein kinase n=1 Tax=Edaphobacter flagellatus TaxID=1933044 RepID=UPI0021B39088|nr:serine/threonine-protein kinase [Edaphobacter flagellatus]
MEIVAKAYAAKKSLHFRKRVGAGAFKETFLVDDGTRSLALKVIGHKSSHSRTEREIDAIVRCSHPNIAQLESVETFSLGTSTYTCLIEEYIAGGTLADRVKTTPLTREQTLEVGAALIEVLDHLYQLNLVHRDLKPDNIMFRSSLSWQPVVVDFGIVRDLSRSSLTQTWVSMGPGTPLFAPSEQLNNRKEMIDWRSDQFALGVTLTMAQGRKHPYSTDLDSGYECVDRVADGSDPQAQFFRFAVESHLPALRKMVNQFPIDRFRTPSQLRDAWRTQ